MRIVWTEDAKKYLVPTRAEHVAGDKPPTPAAAWKAARKEYTTSHAYWAKGPDSAPPETRELLRGALAWLGASDQPPETFPELDVIAAASFLAPSVVGFLTVRQGLPAAYRAVLRASDWQRSFGAGTTWIAAAPPESRVVAAPSSLRIRFLLADAAVQQECLAIAEAAFPRARQAVKAALVNIVPEQHAWAREVATTYSLGQLDRNLADGLLASIDDLDLVEPALKVSSGAAAGIVNVVDRFGEAAVPVLSRVIANAEQSHEAKHTARALTLIRTREAGEALATHLTRSVVRPFAAEFFAAEPEIARAVLPAFAKGKKKVAQVAAEMLTRVERASAAGAGGEPEATVAALPRVLARPPWRETKRPRRKRGVVPDLGFLPYSERIAMEPAALLAAVETRGGYGYKGAQSMNEEELARYLERAQTKEGRAQFPYDWTMQRGVPEAQQVRVWNEAGPGLNRSFVAAAHLHAAHGLLPLPGTLIAFETLLARAWGQRPEVTLLAALDTPRIAPLVARALSEPRMSSPAKTWLLGDAERAAIGLVPTAVGPDGAAREAAERALRFLEGRGHGEVLRAVGAEYGADAQRALDEVLAWDPLWDCPKKPPKMPPYWRVAELTRPRLRDGSPLSLEAVAALDEMLAFTSVDPPYAGIGDVIAACEPRGLAEHAWDLATTWEQNRSKRAHGWMIDALVHLADEDVVRRTTPALESDRIVVVLGRIGTDAAAMELATIVARQMARGKNVQYGIGAAAEKQLDEIAAARGIDPDAFEDQITPTLDVDDAGGVTLDYGSRTLRVGFDERLDPYVADDEGGRMRNLPPGRKTDDKAKVKAAQQAWKELREDVRVIADRRIAALERAMAVQRQWTPEAFRAAFVDHPLMLHLARRLIWAARDAGRRVLGTFRVAEDRSYADVKDDPFTVPADAKITLPHPARWPDDSLGAWRTVLADYQLLQPFSQIDRPYMTLDAAALAKPEHTQDRAPGAQGAPGTAAGLQHLGWIYYSQGGGLQTYRKNLGDGSFLKASWPLQAERDGAPLPITLSYFRPGGETAPIGDVPREILAETLYDLYVRG